MKKTALINATLVDPSQKINKKGSLLIENKNIVKLIFNNNNFSEQDFNIINCKGLILCPGFVDIKCHLRVPGQEHKENLSYASKSAASAA